MEPAGAVKEKGLSLAERVTAVSAQREPVG